MSRRKNRTAAEFEAAFAEWSTAGTQHWKLAQDLIAGKRVDRDELDATVEALELAHRRLIRVVDGL